MLKIEKKTGGHLLVQRCVSVVIALCVAGLVIAVCGYNPLVVYREMLAGSFGSAYYVQQTIQKVIPLLVMGLGVAVCFISPQRAHSSSSLPSVSQVASRMTMLCHA